MSKIFIIYGHYDEKSFHAAILKTFLEECKKLGHFVDLVDLYKDKFNPVWSGEKHTAEIYDYRDRISNAEVLVMIAPIWNFRMPAIVEGFIDKVLAPPFAYRFKKIWGTYGYSQGNLTDKKAIIFCGYGAPRFAIELFFQNLPFRRLKAGVLKMCGIKDITYRRYFAVPFVSDDKRKKYLQDVVKTTKKI